MVPKVLTFEFVSELGMLDCCQLRIEYLRVSDLPMKD